MDYQAKTMTENKDGITLSHGVADEDVTLAKRDKNSVDFALNYSKLWCKFCRDIIISFEKRAQYENENIRNVSKLFQTLESSANCFGVPMSREIVLLSKSIIDQGKELEQSNSKRYRELVEVIGRQRTEFAKTRKFLKEKWKQELKKMADAESTLFKTRNSYFQRCQNGVKLREELAQAQTAMNDTMTMFANESSIAGLPGVLIQNFDASTVPEEAANAQVLTQLANHYSKHRTKVDGLEKKLAENDKKEIEQMYAYRDNVESANKRLVELEKCKSEILCDVRLTVIKCDEVVRDSLTELCEHMYSTRYKISSQYQNLSQEFRDYEPCSQYIRLIMSNVDKKPEIPNFKYTCEGYHDLVQSGQIPAKADASIGRFVNKFTSVYGIKDIVDPADPNRPTVVHGSDSDSDLEDTTNMGANRGGNVLNSLVEFGSNLFRPDSKKMSIRIKNRPNTIVQPSHADVENAAAQLSKEFSQATIPIAYCIMGIEKKPEGLATHGIYRVPASKVKVASVGESLGTLELQNCYQPENLSNLVMDEHPLTLSSLIKSKLISLSEPLFTFNMYSNLIEVGKALETLEPSNPSYAENIDKLAKSVQQLPGASRRAAGMLFHHLHRVTEYQIENQMNAMNLGTMFGPTVLKVKPKFQVANMMEFVDNKAQVKFVEKMIEHVDEIFVPSEQYDPHNVLRSIEDEYNADQNYGDLEEEGSEHYFSLQPEPSPYIERKAGIIVNQPPASYTPYKDTALAQRDANKTSVSASTCEDKSSLNSMSTQGYLQASPGISGNISSLNSPRDQPGGGTTSLSLATSLNNINTSTSSKLNMATSSSTGSDQANIADKSDSMSYGTTTSGGNITDRVTGLKKLVTSKSQQLQQQIQAKFGPKDEDERSTSSLTVSKLVIGKRRSFLKKNRQIGSTCEAGSSPSSTVRSVFSSSKDRDKAKYQSSINIADCDYIDFDDEYSTDA